MEVLRKSEDQRPKNAHEENMLFCVRFASVWLPIVYLICFQECWKFLLESTLYYQYK